MHSSKLDGSMVCQTTTRVDQGSQFTSRELDLARGLDCELRDARRHGTLSEDRVRDFDFTIQKLI